MTEKPSVQRIAAELYAFLSRRFPVCCASDEFTYFPQAVVDEPDWSTWDDLSPESLEDALSGLRLIRARLEKLMSTGDDFPIDQAALTSVMVWVTQTLEEQFTLIRTHATQPTFTITLATSGLVQAIQSDDPEALTARLQALPKLFEKSLESLFEVPDLYRDMGMEMAGKLLNWLSALGDDSHIASAQEAVFNYMRELSSLMTNEDFRLERDILEHVVNMHTGSGMSLAEALRELEEEEGDLVGLLKEEAVKLGYGADWEAGYRAVPGDRLPEDGVVVLLRREINRLKDHCRQLGLIDPVEHSPENLVIEELPGSLEPVRAADSYNAIPGHPFPGGVFFIFGGGSLGDTSGDLHPVYRMTAAHETYPGHHLLDQYRWNNPMPALRPLEYPLYYEGWACFGEYLMLETGAFQRPYDRLIYLRRRFRHAVRGRIDLKLHSGELDLAEAAHGLTIAGFSQKRAAETVRKYALRPAYQMCYTSGLRRFQRLFELHGQGNIARFVSDVLTSGEILFDDLEKVMEGTAGRDSASRSEPEFQN